MTVLDQKTGTMSGDSSDTIVWGSCRRFTLRSYSGPARPLLISRHRLGKRPRSPGLSWAVPVPRPFAAITVSPQGGHGPAAAVISVVVLLSSGRRSGSIA